MLVQKTIINGISELLYTHDYVVVPGFGGFVSRPQLAHYSLNKEVLFPPSKTIVFNVQLKQNDGILANWLKEKVNCDFIQATKHLEEFSAHCKMLLDTKHRLEFESLGLFYIDFEKNICFEPKADVNFLIDSFGLSSVTLKELEKEEPVIVKPVIETKDRFVKVETEVPVKKRNYKRIAALAIGIPFVGLALLFAVSQIKSNSNSYSNLFSFGHSAPSYMPVNYNSNFNELDITANPSYVVDANGYAGITLFEDKHIAVNISAVKTESHTVAKHISHSIPMNGKFQVVMGCFSVEGNARKMIRKLAAKNVTAGISGTNSKGMYVVSCGAFDNKDAAVELLQSIKSDFPSAWVMTQN